MQQTEKEKKNKQMGAIISVGTHIVILLIFLFVVAWKAPNPPLPEIGIELNFGLDEAGTGEEQPEPFTTPAESDSDEDAAPDGMEEVPEEVVEDQTPVEETSEPVTEPVESTEQPTEEVVNTHESPDVVEEVPVAEDKKEEVKEEVTQEEAPKLPPVLYPNNKPGAGGTDGDANNAQNANQGDKQGEVGDQGDKDGKVNEKALYGNAGGGGGSSLQMTGWMWDSKPKPNDTSSESGKIVFQVDIDNKGDIERIKTIVSTVSPTLKKVYEDEVRKLTFSKTSGTSVASTSTGTITFIIKAN